MTSVKNGGFCGWPYGYFGRHVDERVQPRRPDLSNCGRASPEKLKNKSRRTGIVET